LNEQFQVQFSYHFQC